MYSIIHRALHFSPMWCIVFINRQKIGTFQEVERGKTHTQTLSMDFNADLRE